MYVRKPQPLKPNTAALRALRVMHPWLSTRTVQLLGGAIKLLSLSPEARGVIINPYLTGDSDRYQRGGLRARGMAPQKRGLDTQREQSRGE